jgi:hypothetical protein
VTASAALQIEQHKYSPERHEDSMVSSKRKSRGSLEKKFADIHRHPLSATRAESHQRSHDANLLSNIFVLVLSFMVFASPCCFRLAGSQILNCLMGDLVPIFLSSQCIPVPTSGFVNRDFILCALLWTSHGPNLSLCSVSLLALNHLPRILFCFFWTHPLALHRSHRLSGL